MCDVSVLCELVRANRYSANRYVRIGTVRIGTCESALCESVLCESVWWRIEAVRIEAVCFEGYVVRPPRTLPSLSPPSFQLNQTSAIFMSSTGQSTSSTSNIQSIIDASLDYTRLTEKDFSKDSLATLFKHSNSPEAILKLLQRRNNALDEYHDRNQKLIISLGPTVRVLQVLSQVVSEADNLVSETYHPVRPST